MKEKFKPKFRGLSMDYDKGKWERETLKMKPVVDTRYSIPFVPTGMSEQWFDFQFFGHG